MVTSGRWNHRPLGDGPVAPLIGLYAILGPSIAAILLFVGRGEAIAFVVVVTFLFHVVIYSRESSIPLLLPLLSLLFCVPLLTVNEEVGVVGYLLLSGLSVSVYATRFNTALIPFPLLYIVGVIGHTLILPVLANGDASGYFNQLAQYQSTVGYFQSAMTQIIARPELLRNAELTFPILYAPLYYSLDLSIPANIVMVNVVLWFATALMVRELVKWRFPDRSQYSGDVAFAVLLLSPSAMYWTGTFNKEIASAFFCVLAAYLFLRERYLLFGIVLVIATGIRPYSIAIIAVYVAVFRRSFTLLVLGIFGSVGVVVAYSGSLLPVVNSIIVDGYLFVSPLPLELGNWLDPLVTLRTLEGVILGGIAVLSVVFFLSKEEYAREYLLLGLGLAICGIVYALVGYHNTVTAGVPYGLFTIGDTVFRKKMTVMPLVLLWVSYTVGVLRAESVLPTIRITYGRE